MILTEAQREFEVNGMTQMAKLLAERAYFIVDELGKSDFDFSALVADMQDSYFDGDVRAFEECMDYMMDYVFSIA